MWITVCDGKFKFQSMENSNRCAIATFLMKQTNHWKSIIQMDDIIWYHICRLVILQISTFDLCTFRFQNPTKPSGKKDGKPLTELPGVLKPQKNPQVLDLLTSCIKDDSVAASELREVCGWQTVGWMDSKTQGIICHQTGKGIIFKHTMGGDMLFPMKVTGPFATWLGRWISLVTKLGYISSLGSITSSGRKQFSCLYKGGMILPRVD